MTLKEIKRSECNDRIYHWPLLQEFKQSEANKVIFYDSGHTVGAVWCMHPGQSLPIHSHKEADDIWIVIQGKADYYPDCGQKVLIQAGDVVVARPGEKHGMTNSYDEDFVMLGIAGPTPIGFIPHELEA